MIVFSPGSRLPVGLYAGAVIGLFTISGLYHRVFWSTRARGAFRRLDHAMIFVLIAATYTPIALATLSTGAALALLVVVWGGAIAGAVLKLSWGRPPRWLSVSLYVVVGWVVVPVIPSLWRALGAAGFTLLLLGGLFHTFGAVVYAVRRPDPSPSWFGYHEVFHTVVVAAVAAHYCLIAFGL